MVTCYNKHVVWNMMLKDFLHEQGYLWRKNTLCIDVCMKDRQTDSLEVTYKETWKWFLYFPIKEDNKMDKILW